MKFGLLYLPTYVPELDGPVGTFYERMLEQIVRADELGFETVWLGEHHFGPYGMGNNPNAILVGADLAARYRLDLLGLYFERQGNVSEERRDQLLAYAQRLMAE